MVYGFYIPPEAEEILKNQTKWRLFLYFVFAFWQGSLDPQSYELDPQLPYNNYQCSLDPWK